jgi:DNA-binding NtrC family response regulator
MMGMEHNGNKSHVLVIEEDEATRSACIEIATRRGFAAAGLAEINEARQLLHDHAVDLLLVEIGENQREDLQLLENVKRLKPEIAVIVMSSSTTIRSAVEAIRSGATEYLVKPFRMEDLELALDNEIKRRKTNRKGDLVGGSQEMEKLHRIVANVAQSRHPALITGERGAGKEMVARTIHAQGESATQPFLTVDCGVLAPELIEHELFGYVEGAFPGALCHVPGVLASAERGTVFLDEIGQLTPDLQGKLLRVLQEKEICPAGAGHRIPFHARILAASSMDLAAAVTKGTFHKDLYYRLNVVTLRIPPLRERRSDIPLLATHFLERRSRESSQNYILSDDTLYSMMEYDWPNNVRELESTIERACTMASGPVIHLGELPTQLRNHELERRRRATQLQVQMTEPVVQPSRSTAYVRPLAEIEKMAILSTIKQLKGDKLLAAQMLGIGKTTLYRKLKEYGVLEMTDAPSELTDQRFQRPGRSFWMK